MENLKNDTLLVLTYSTLKSLLDEFQDDGLNADGCSCGLSEDSEKEIRRCIDCGSISVIRKKDTFLKDSFPVIVCDRNTDLRKVRLYIPFNDVYYEGEVIPKYKKPPLYFAPSCPYKKYPPLRTFPIKEIFGFDTSCPSTTLKTIHDVCDEIYSEAIRLTYKGFNIDDRVRVVEYDTLYFRNGDKFFHIVLDKEERIAYLSPIMNHKPPILLEEVREDSLYKRKSFQDFEKIEVFVKDLLDNVS